LRRADQQRSQEARLLLIQLILYLIHQPLQLQRSIHLL
jgi:hypothetical protein